MGKLIEQLSGARLVTAEILYRLPDQPVLLQSYIWQEYDVPPNFPRLIKFLNFWREELDGPLHSVNLTYLGAVRPEHFRNADALLGLH